MELTAEQKATVATWVRGGAQLNEVQQRLEAELGLKLTYMETRFLVDDLDLDLVAQEKPKDPAEVTVEPTPEPGKVRVEIGRVTPPGAMLGGTATFSDGVTAQWQIDQFGRLALNPSQAGYQPSRDDAVAFQQELQKAVEKSGMM